jgi:hypothetical protein
MAGMAHKSNMPSSEIGQARPIFLTEATACGSVGAMNDPIQWGPSSLADEELRALLADEELRALLAKEGKLDIRAFAERLAATEGGFVCYHMEWVQVPRPTMCSVWPPPNLDYNIVDLYLLRRVGELPGGGDDIRIEGVCLLFPKVPRATISDRAAEDLASERARDIIAALEDPKCLALAAAGRVDLCALELRGRKLRQTEPTR